MNLICLGTLKEAISPFKILLFPLLWLPRRVSIPRMLLALRHIFHLVARQQR